MPEVRPFRGVLYDVRRVEIEKVVTPPYDVISPEEKERYRSLSPYNMVHLLLEPNYVEAAERFRRWLKEGVLIQDTSPSIYIYRRDYELEGERRTDLGFIGLMRIPDRDGSILLHEATFEAPKKDRFLLLKYVKANLSPIFAIFDDPGAQVEARLREEVPNLKPRIELSKDGVLHKLWSVSDPTVISEIVSPLKEAMVLIADGHHRFESARIYRDIMRSGKTNYTGEESFNFVMCYFTSISSEGLAVLPTHRIVSGVDPAKVERRIERAFLQERVSGLERMKAEMRSTLLRGDHPPIGVFDGKGFRLIKVKDKGFLDPGLPESLRDMDVVVLHSLVIPQGARVEFTHETDEVISAVMKTPGAYGFFMNPIDPKRIKRVAAAGYRMPHKSTYFYPKPLSGLVINLHE